MSSKRVNEAMPNCQCPKRKRQCKNRVRWSSDEPSIHEITRHCDFKSDVWYSKKDYQDFQIETCLNVQCLQRVVSGDTTPLNPDLVCFRGLEPYKTEQTRIIYLFARQTHVKTVIEEQRLQSMFFVHDPERFRRVVALKSHQALRVAQQRATMDEKEIYPKGAIVNKQASIAQKNRIVPLSMQSIKPFDGLFSNEPVKELLSMGCIKNSPSPQYVSIRAS